MSAFLDTLNTWLANPAVYVLVVLAAWAACVCAAVAAGRRLRRRARVRRWKAAWRQAQGRPPIILPATNAHGFFANGRPGDTCRHRNAVPVETLDGETVAALCPDCGEQLEPEAAPTAPTDYRGIEAEHEADHHGHWSIFLIACRLCAEECSPHLAAQPFTPDPRLTQRIKE